MRFKVLAMFLILAITPTLYSAEAYHYTVPAHEIEDITYQLNTHTNFLVQQVLDDINTQGGCRLSKNVFGSGKTAEEKLYKALKKIFFIHGRSILVDDILDGYMPTTTILLRDSVYKEWNITSGVALIISQLTLSPNIKVGGKVIGVDKLEHMFAYGLKYFRQHYISGMEMEKVLRLGAAAEKVYLGGNVMETGVFSYGDLAANFNGMRFWNHILQKNDDILGEEYNLGPYIICEGGKWKKNPERPIDLSKYMDRSVQENYNCSKFATKSGLSKFTNQLRILAFENKNPSEFQCPVSRHELDEAALKYAVPIGATTIDHWIINRNGNQVVSYTDEF